MRVNVLSCHAGLHAGIRKPLSVRPQSMLEAKDLPRCPLSDSIEEHLHNTIQQDRQIRAEMEKKLVEDVSPPPSHPFRMI